MEENTKQPDNNNNSGADASYAYQLEEVAYGKKMHHTLFNGLVHKIKEDKDWYDDMVKICKTYYEVEPTGGSLHIVLDDDNIEDTHVDWCAGYACGQGDELGNNIANLMRHMTLEQREKLVTTDWYA